MINDVMVGFVPVVCKNIGNIITVHTLIARIAAHMYSVSILRRFPLLLVAPLLRVLPTLIVSLFVNWHLLSSLAHDPHSRHRIPAIRRLS
jgi:hypothetical protein